MRQVFRNRRLFIYGTLLLLGLLVLTLRGPLRYMIMNRTLALPRTTQQVVQELEPQVRQEFEPIFLQLGLQWPASRIQMLAFKQERVLELWAADEDGPFQFIAEFPIIGMSGTLGPKRRSGDLQVPEGFYRLTHLNPQSSFHLSIRVDYPNSEDIENRSVERELMGGDIYIHGREASVGCLAMGDAAIEKIFVLTALARPEHRHIIISPLDFRNATEAPFTTSKWLKGLYGRQQAALEQFQRSTEERANLRSRASNDYAQK